MKDKLEKQMRKCHKKEKMKMRKCQEYKKEGQIERRNQKFQFFWLSKKQKRALREDSKKLTFNIPQ